MAPQERTRETSGGDAPQETPLHPPGDWARYYAIVSKRDVSGRAGHDQEWRLSPNGMCVLGLSASHAAFAEGRTPASVTFNDELHCNFSGKRKKGAKQLQANTTICFIQCTDGATFPVFRSVARGSPWSCMSLSQRASFQAHGSQRFTGFWGRRADTRGASFGDRSVRTRVVAGLRGHHQSRPRRPARSRLLVSAFRSMFRNGFRMT